MGLRHNYLSIVLLLKLLDITISGTHNEAGHFKSFETFVGHVWDKWSVQRHFSFWGKGMYPPPPRCAPGYFPPIILSFRITIISLHNLYRFFSSISRYVLVKLSTVWETPIKGKLQSLQHQLYRRFFLCKVTLFMPYISIEKKAQEFSFSEKSQLYPIDKIAMSLWQ